MGHKKTIIIIISIIAVFLSVIGSLILIDNYGGGLEPGSGAYMVENFCREDSDCVLAVNLNTCCGCPFAVNQENFYANRNLVMYEQGKDYSAFITKDCSNVQCVSCISPREAICISNQCVKINNQDNQRLK